MKHLILFIAFLAVFTVVNAEENYFLENKGQLIDQHGNERFDIKFYATADGNSIFISDSGFSIQTAFSIDENRTQFNRVDFNIAGFSPDSFKGKQPTAYQETHVTDMGDFHLKSYKRVVCSDYNTGIEVHFYISTKGFKYDIVIPENSSLSEVDINVKGAKISQQNNSILIQNGALKLTETIPEIYHLNQEKKSPIEGKYELTQNGYRISFENDKNAPLVVDPYLTYGSFYGGNSTDEIRCVDSDENGNYIIAGKTSSSSNMATVGAYTATYSIYGNMFMAKFDKNDQRLWGTYYHTTSVNPRELEIDSDGNFYISGMTGSGDNLGTAGTHQTFFGGDFNDCFILKMNSDGFPIWSTMYGGNGNDILLDMKLDLNSEYLYIVGETRSDSLISTPGAFIENRPGNGFNADGFMAKFDTSGVLELGTYVGGYNSDKLEGVVVNNDGVYVVGNFNSNGLGTPGSFYENKFSNSDLFLSKFDHSLAQVWGTYFTGDQHTEFGHSLAVFGGKIYVSFSVHGNASNEYSTPGAYKESSDSGYEGCILQFDTSGTNWNWGTYYGGSQNDFISHITKINDTTIAISGRTSSMDSIATNNVHKPYLTNGVSPNFPYGPTEDMFVVVMDTAASNIHWGSYYGGPKNEQVNDMVIMPSNEILTVGHTFSLTNISTNNAHQYHAYSSFQPSGFIAKFDTDRDSIFTDPSAQLPGQICPKEYLDVPFTTMGTYFDDNMFQLWMSDENGDFSNATLMSQMSGTTGDTFNIQMPYLTTGGMYQFKVSSTSPAVEGLPSNSIEILASPQTEFTYQIGSNDVYFTDQSNGAQSWLWSFDTGDQSVIENPVYDFPNVGSYMVQLVSDNGVCSDTAVHEVQINNVAGLEDLNNEIIVAPNPTKDYWAIQIPHNDFEVKIYSMQGKLCYQSKSMSKQFELPNLQSGTYIIKLKDKKTGSVYNKEIVKL